MSENKDAFFSKLEELNQRYRQIQQKIAEPDIASDHSKLIPLTKEQGKLKSIVNKYRALKKTQEGIKDSEEIINDESSEEDFKDLAKDELKELQEKYEKQEEDLKDIFVMSDDMDVKSIMIEIRAGTGGDEAALFARDLYNMYAKYAEDRKWKNEPLAFRPTEMGGLKEAIFCLKGRGVWSELGYEGGTHRVQRVPETESQGRIHTSAATVAVLPEPEELEINIDASDVEEHVSRSSGPGGQSVNKLSSAVKLVHKPTGISVSMQDEKSQHKNRAKAWRILKSRIYEHYESEKQAEIDSKRKSMIGSGDRSQKIRTYNFPQNRVTDHRIKVSLYSLDKIIAGDLSELIKSLKEHDKQERLKKL